MGDQHFGQRWSGLDVKADRAGTEHRPQHALVHRYCFRLAIPRFFAGLVVSFFWGVDLTKRALCG